MIDQADETKTKNVNVWVDSWLRDALDRLCKKHRRRIRDEVAIALEEYAAKHGELPPAE